MKVCVGSWWTGGDAAGVPGFRDPLGLSRVRRPPDLTGRHTALEFLARHGICLEKASECI